MFRPWTRDRLDAPMAVRAVLHELPSKPWVHVVARAVWATLVRFFPGSCALTLSSKASPCWGS